MTDILENDFHQGLKKLLEKIIGRACYEHHHILLIRLGLLDKAKEFGC